MTDLLDSLCNALYDAVSRLPLHRPIGIAFSGGVDSSMLAKICQDLGADLTLLTVGFPDSQDIIFSKKIAEIMNLRHRIEEINDIEFPNVIQEVTKMMSCRNTSHIENCIAYRYVASLAAENGIDTVVSANGCDELFCGYNGYREMYSHGEESILKMMNEKLVNEHELVTEIRAVASRFEVQIEQPFLSPSFVAFSKTIPVSEKIVGSNDLVRKHILRKAAVRIGVPLESSTNPKKALQYGSLLHKHFKKIQRQSSTLID